MNKNLEELIQDFNKWWKASFTAPSILSCAKDLENHFIRKAYAAGRKEVLDEIENELQKYTNSDRINEIKQLISKLREETK